MKKQILIFVLAIINFSLSAQFNISISGKYSQSIDKNRAFIYSANYGTDTTYTYNKIGYGQGFSPNVNFSYLFRDKINFGISFQYLKSKEQTIVLSGDKEPSYYDNKTALSKAFFISPTIKYNINNWLYCGFGVKMSIYQQINGNDDYSRYFGNDLTIVQREYTESSNFGIGANFLIGAKYKLTEKLNLFIELDYTDMQINLSKGHYNTYTVDGVEYSSTLDYSSLHWIYSNELSSITTDKTKPEERMIDNSSVLSYSSIGIQIGLKYWF